jgi:hypothetical protein
VCLSDSRPQKPAPARCCTLFVPPAAPTVTEAANRQILGALRPRKFTYHSVEGTPKQERPPSCHTPRQHLPRQVDAPTTHPHPTIHIHMAAYKSTQTHTHTHAHTPRLHSCDAIEGASCAMHAVRSARSDGAQSCMRPCQGVVRASAPSPQQWSF